MPVQNVSAKNSSNHSADRLLKPQSLRHAQSNNTFNTAFNSTQHMNLANASQTSTNQTTSSSQSFVLINSLNEIDIDNNDELTTDKHSKVYKRAPSKKEVRC